MIFVKDMPPRCEVCGRELEPLGELERCALCARLVCPDCLHEADCCFAEAGDHADEPDWAPAGWVRLPPQEGVTEGWQQWERLPVPTLVSGPRELPDPPLRRPPGDSA